MRTTLDLPEELLQTAQRILETDTKTGTIVEALKRIINLHERQKLIRFRGKIDLDIDLDAIRGRNECPG